jgi:large subunit ribosomal protein L4
MKLTIKDITGKDSGELEVKFEVIQNGKGTQAVQDVVVAMRANRRSGTACTKTMGDVNGTGKKPWRQKGTGRARAGSFASPLWRGGGVVFGPKPRDFSKKVNGSTKQLALRKALSERLKEGAVIVVEDIKLENPKTKSFVAFMDSIGVMEKALVVVAGENKNLALASRNAVGVELTTGIELNVYQILNCDKVVITREAFAQVEERLTKE